MEEQQDVTQTVETETTSSPSATEQTTQVEAQPTQEEKYVPYDRFKEVNEELKTYRQELENLKSQLTPKEQEPEPDSNTLAVKEQLRKLGFITREEQEAEMRRKDEDARVEQELTQLEKRLDGSDGRPKFSRQDVIKYALEKQIGDLETAYERLHREKIIDWHIQQAMQKSKGVKSEASDGSGSSEAGTTNDDLKSAIQKGDKSALKAYIKRQFSFDK